ncbi:hypothetical protein M0654_21780 [Rhizobium sp. NTR19]|uniref:Uncharacterized protein n=1 Tax=Neorhizobium turbinariae TaxID=2937795 RepID=A0ABT0IXK4_9HYPH|nr:hypothetical protein [Neorhizobium turbinariae]
MHPSQLFGWRRTALRSRKESARPDIRFPTFVARPSMAEMGARSSLERRNPGS